MPTKNRNNYRFESVRPFFRKLQRARRHVDSSPVKRLDWLLRFTYEDLNALSAKQMDERRWDLTIFAVKGRTIHDIIVAADKDMTWVYLQTFLPPHLDNAKASELLKSFQLEMRKNLDVFYSPVGWTHTSYERHTIRYGKIADGEYQSQWVADYTPVGRLVDTAFELAEPLADRLLKCERCGKPFVEKRKGRAKFCSRECSTYVKLKNWRAQQREKGQRFTTDKPGEK